VSENEHRVEPYLLVNGYRGFNILVYDSRCFALACEEGAFDILKVARNEYRRCFEGLSADEVMAKVEEAADQDVSPRLKERGYSGFDIIECGPMVYALQQGQGEFDLKKFESKEYTRCFVGKSAEEVKKQVDEVAARDLTPCLREHGYRGFNIIECGPMVYALAHDEGAFDLKKLERKEYTRCLVEKTVAEVKRLVDEASAQDLTPWLREQGFRGFNIIECGPLFYALSQDEGAFDLRKFQRKEYRRCFSGRSLNEVKKHVIEVRPIQRSLVYRTLNGLASLMRNREPAAHRDPAQSIRR